MNNDLTNEILAASVTAAEAVRRGLRREEIATEIYERLVVSTLERRPVREGPHGDEKAALDKFLLITADLARHAAGVFVDKLEKTENKE